MNDLINVLNTGAAPKGAGPYGVGGGKAPKGALPSQPADGRSAASGAPDPSQSVTQAQQAKDAKAAAQQLEMAAQELQKRAEESGADLSFRVDEDTGQMVVSVVDRKDGTVLRQIPGEEALRIAKALAKFQNGEGSGGLVQVVA